jgi:putative FmdB family regulatory protein
MPTYEYRCPDGHSFDLFQKMSDDPEAPCPECGKTASRQISGGAGFLFKGEGFYITDYRSKEYRKKASSESGGGGEGTGSAKKASGDGTSGSGVDSGGGAAGESTGGGPSKGSGDPGA